MPATVVTGDGNASEFVRMAAVELSRELGFTPYHGTLNLEARREDVVADLLQTTVTDVGDGDYCAGVALYPCRIDGVLASAIVPDVPGYPSDTVEILAPVHLRSLFDLADGDIVRLTPPGTPSDPTSHSINPEALESFGAVVFDERLVPSKTDASGERARIGSASATKNLPEAFGDGMAHAIVGRGQDGGEPPIERVLECLAELDADPGAAAFVTPDRDAASASFSVLSANALTPR